MTAKNIKGLFEHFAKACGKRLATRFDDVGAWGLDYNPVYGGVVIYEVANTGGAQSHPFGSERHKPQELWYMMRFAMDAMRVKGVRTDPRRRAGARRRVVRRVWRRR
jgi:hypothetical protein